MAAGSSSDGESISPDVLVVKLGPDGEMNGSCSLVRDSAFSAEESRLPKSDGILHSLKDDERTLTGSHDALRDSRAVPAILCPE